MSVVITNNLSLAQSLSVRVFAVFCCFFMSVSLAKAAEADFVTSYELVAGSVVNVATYSSTGVPSFVSDDQVAAYMEKQRRTNKPQNLLRNLGTGFVIDSAGFVLTSSHVVRDQESLVVQFKDRQEYPAKVVGVDENSDIALLKIMETRDGLKALQPVPAGSVKPGQWVLAIGSPFGLDFSVSKGIVSAVDRTLSDGSHVAYIQTDVPTNPGNSGGPLINLKGQVLGVNTQILTDDGHFDGVSFAVPIDLAQSVAQQLKEKGFVERPWLGVVVQDVTKSLAESFGLTSIKGALIAHVVPDGPADKAGLMIGDVITQADQQVINAAPDLPQLVGRQPVGTEVELSLIRIGKPLKLKLTLSMMPPEVLDVSPESMIETSRDFGKEIKITQLGVAVADVGQDALKGSSIKSAVRVMSQVSAENPFQLEPGDLITMLNGNPVVNAETLLGSLNALDRQKWVPMLVVRKGQPRFVPIRVE